MIGTPASTCPEASCLECGAGFVVRELRRRSGGGKLAFSGGFSEKLSGAGRGAPADRRQAAVTAKAAPCDNSVSHKPSELRFCLTTASHDHGNVPGGAVAYSLTSKLPKFQSIGALS